MRTRLLNSPRQPASQPASSRSASAQRRPMSVWLYLARAAFIALGIVALIACVASVPAAVARFGSICTSKVASNCPDAQATAAGASTLQSLGISLHVYAIYTVTLILVATVIYVVVAGLIFWRHSDSWMGLFTATFLLTFGIGANGFIDTLATQQPIWTPLISSITALGNVSIVVFFFIFPNGRFVPRWTVWAVVAYMAQVPGIFTPALRLPEYVSGLLFVAIVLIMVLATIYRYRRVSTTIERQQTKWVVFGGVLTAGVELGLALTLLWFDLTTNQARSIFDLIGNTAYIVVPVAIPLAIGVAILRYRLWDIDIIINRALVYGSLTAALAAVYFCCVLGAQTVVQALTGARTLSAYVVVASTLLIAALFMPLRRRLQATIDRRFYRRKYDATRTLERFGETLRREVDLYHLSDHLIGAVAETMQPTNVSLWLRPSPLTWEADAATALRGVQPREGGGR